MISYIILISVIVAMAFVIARLKYTVIYKTESCHSLQAELDYRLQLLKSTESKSNEYKELARYFAYTLHHTGQDLQFGNWSKFEADPVYAGQLVENIGVVIQNRLSIGNTPLKLIEKELEQLSNRSLVFIAGYLLSGWKYESIPLIVDLRDNKLPPEAFLPSPAN